MILALEIIAAWFVLSPVLAVTAMYFLKPRFAKHDQWVAEQTPSSDFSAAKAKALSR